MDAFAFGIMLVEMLTEKWPGPARALVDEEEGEDLVDELMVLAVALVVEQEHMDGADVLGWAAISVDSQKMLCMIAMSCTASEPERYSFRTI
jgi:hypothetical protein